MIKNKLDYKLLNCALIMVIIFLLYKTGGLWFSIINKLFDLMLPFLISFVVAYALYPFIKFLTNHKIPKGIAILISVVLLIGIFVIFGFIVIPLLFNQMGNLFNSIMAFINQISFDYDLSLGSFSDALSNTFNTIITNLGKYVSDGAISAISISISVITKIFIIFSSTIYILLDMDNLRLGLKKYLKRKSKKLYNYVVLLDKSMHSYLSGFIKIMIISLFEYSFAYIVIRHPNALMLGCLAMIANLIPYFGGMINNVVAAVTAFVISPALFIKTLIVFVILSIIDGYIINPLVYGKTNEVHPLVVIMSVFIGGALFGVIGIIISLPVAIILITTFKYFKEDVKDKIEDIKDNKKN